MGGLYGCALVGALLGVIVGVLCTLFHWASFGTAWAVTLAGFFYFVLASTAVIEVRHLVRSRHEREEAIGRAEAFRALRAAVSAEDARKDKTAR
jgi:hypothetical protein